MYHYINVVKIVIFLYIRDSVCVEEVWRVDSAEIRHEAGAGLHSETVMAPGHTVWVLIKPAQCVKQGLKLALATQSGS